MAEDLNQTRQVAGVLNKEPTVPTYQRTATVEPVGTPAIGATVRELATQSNWMSDIGSKVATGASNALAQQLGGQAGKHPEGSYLPPITEFDKNFARAYTTQAHSTLGLQANKLITDSNIALAKSPRLSPEMIAQKQSEVQIGLRNIYKNAPAEIRPELESQYGSLMISQNQQLNNRMISEQREDQRNNIALASQKNAEIVNTLEMAGDTKGADAALQATIKANEAGVAAHYVNPLVAKTSIDTVRQSQLTGRLIRQGRIAQQNGKLEEFKRSLADKKPDYISDADYIPVLGNFQQYFNQQEALRREDEQLRISKFQLSSVMDIGGITGEQIADLQANIPEKQFNDTMIWYQKLKDAHDKAGKTTSDVIANWGNFNTFSSNFTDKDRLDGLEAGAAALVQKRANDGVTISMPEAEMHMAAVAAGPIAGYIKKIDAKAQSGNPQQLNEASAAIDYIGHSGRPQNLTGISENSLGMIKMYNAFRDSHDELTAANMAREVIYNKSPEQRKINDDNWKAHVQASKKQGQTNGAFALSVAGVDPDTLVNVPQLSEFVADKYEGYFKMTNGNKDVAQQMLKHDIDTTFGYTYVNGKKEYAHLPINMVYNIPDDANGFIHADLQEQLEKQFATSKEYYDKGLTNSYWEVKPKVEFKDYIVAINKIDQLTGEVGIFDTAGKRPELSKWRKVVDEFKSSAPPTLILHHRDGSLNSYEAVISSSPMLSRTSNTGSPIAGYYDINLRSGDSLTSIVNQDPSAGPVRYIPNRGIIVEGYSITAHNPMKYSDANLISKFHHARSERVKEQSQREGAVKENIRQYMGYIAKGIAEQGLGTEPVQKQLLSFAHFVKNRGGDF